MPRPGTVPGARAVVCDLELEIVRVVTEKDPGARGAGVLEGIRQRLLHDPVGGEVDARRQFSRFAFDGHLDRQSGSSHLLDQPVELPQAWLWRERELLVAPAKHAEQAA